MKKNLYATFITIFLACSLQAQHKELTISHKRNKDNSISFRFKKENPGSTYLEIKFKNLKNTSQRKIVKKTIKGWNGFLLKLTPINKKKSISFSYSYSSIRGSRKAKVNHNFVYLLPFKQSKKIIARDLSYLGKRFGNTNPENWKSIQFITKPNTAVYAARKGIVVDIENKYESNQSLEYNYRSDANYIIIEHKDGTLAKYGVLKKNSILVKLGQKVFPTTPLATTGSYDKPENNQLRFSVYFLDKNINLKRDKTATLATQKHRYNYVNPLFFTEKGTQQLENRSEYISAHTKDIIELEMTRRQKKKWLKKNK